MQCPTCIPASHQFAMMPSIVYVSRFIWSVYKYWLTRSFHSQHSIMTDEQSDCTVFNARCTTVHSCKKSPAPWRSYSSPNSNDLFTHTISRLSLIKKVCMVLPLAEIWKTDNTLTVCQRVVSLHSIHFPCGWTMYTSSVCDVMSRCRFLSAMTYYGIQEVSTQWHASVTFTVVILAPNCTTKCKP